jgi:tetratricopeptide (TPR) repeat protein
LRTTLQELQRAVQAGNYYLARQCFLELLVEPDAPLPQVFCEMSVAEYQHGNTRAALTFSEAGDKLLANQPAKSPELTARLRNHLVVLYREVGDMSRAISLGRKYVEEAGDDPALSFRRGQILYNLALAYRQRGGPRDNAEALRYYELARRELRRANEITVNPAEQELSRQLEIMAIQNHAWLLCEMGEVDQAQEYAGMAAKLLAVKGGAQQLEQNLLTAYIAYNRRDLTGCMSLLQDLQRYADQASHRQLFWEEWLAARVSLLNHQPMLADVHAALAAAEADRTNEVYLMRLAAELAREIRTAG